MRRAAAFLAMLALVACNGLGQTGVLDDRSPFTGTAKPNVDRCTDRDRAASGAEWAKLRTAFPYHLQAVAISPPFPSGCRALIIAEPPPVVSQNMLQQVAPSVLGSSTTRQHKIGYDGWTADIVYTIPPIREVALAEVVADLHATMFGTTYRRQVISTNTRPPAFDAKATPLDITVGPGDLNRWLLADRSGKFEPLLGGPKQSLRQLLEARVAGIHVDAADGLVAWIVPRDADISGMAALVRQFALESDLIVGAIASPETVAIIARRRIVDPLVLQPLRFETVALLAGIRGDALAQSYERGHLLAGKTDDRQDWAPIYLSPELRDTEYGSVLNIADQLLKSWSNNGDTHYINFNYPTPLRWAFSAPVHRVVGAQTITYNWNTRHAGAAIPIDNFDVFWLRRTGALNVSYFPDGSDADPSLLPPGIAAVEDKAQNFFASVQDPFLVRVVQYNSLYQIFRHYELKSSLVPALRSDADAERELGRVVRDALIAIRNADVMKLPPRLQAGLKNQKGDVRSRVAAAIEFASLMLSGMDDGDLEALATALATPHESAVLSGRLLGAYRLFNTMAPLIREFSSSTVHVDYAKAVAARSGVWIHTPSIVLSWNDTNRDSVIGGHNLDAAITEVRYSPRRSAPAVVDSKGNLLTGIGPAELDRLVLGRQGPRLAKAPRVQPPRVALGIKTDPKPPSAGWRVAESQGAPSSAYDVHVARLGDGYQVTVGRSGRRYQATTLPDVTELLGSTPAPGTGTLRIELKGFNPDEARNVLGATEVRIKGKVVGVLDSPPRFATQAMDFSKARILEAETRVYREGAGAVGITVVVPVRRSSFTMKVKAAFRMITPGRLKSAAKQADETVANVITRQPTAAPRDVGLLLQEELESVLSADFVEVKMQMELTDFTIVDRDAVDSHGTNRLPG